MRQTNFLMLHCNIAILQLFESNQKHRASVFDLQEKLEAFEK